MFFFCFLFFVFFFDWNRLGSRYPIRPNKQNMAILAENKRLRLKVMLRGPKL